MTAKISASSKHPLSWLPNALTTGRILSIPIIIWGILAMSRVTEGFVIRPSWIIALFLLAAITDFFDGYLARRWNVASNFGRMIDPIADKLLVAGCIIAFAIVSKGNWIILIPGIAIVFRDIFVSGIREHAALSNRAMPPTQLAKWKTACEMLSIFILLIWVAAQALAPIDDTIPVIVSYTGIVGAVILWIAASLSVFTGYHYFKAAISA